MKILVLAFFLLAPALGIGQSFIHRVYQPSYSVDLNACTQNNGINCFAGNQSAASANVLGKMYAFDSIGNLSFETLHLVPNHWMFYTSVCPGPGNGFTAAAYIIFQPGGTSVPIMTQVDSSGSLVSSAKVITANGAGATPGGILVMPDSTTLLAINHGGDVHLLEVHQGVLQRQIHITNDSLFGPSSERVSALKRSANGDIYLFGTATVSGHYHNAFVHKLDLNLQHLWTSIVADTNIHLSDMDINASGRLQMSGEFEDTSGYSLPFLVEMDTTGSVTWAMIYTASLTLYTAASLATSPDSSSDIIGIDEPGSPGFDKITRIHVDSLGQVEFGMLINSSSYPAVSGKAEVGTDGSLLITGSVSTSALALKLEADSMVTCLSAPFSVSAAPYNLSSIYFIPAIDTPAFQLVALPIQASGSLVKQVLCFTTGMEETATYPRIDYMNPVSDRILLENIEAFDRISVYDITGRCMVTDVIRHSNAWQYDIQDWPQGFYLIQLDGVSRRTIKVIRQ